MFWGLYILGEAIWADNSKKFYNQIRYEEQFEPGFAKLECIKLRVFLVKNKVLASY